jgi:ADP-ribosylglycohydrolase
MPSSHADCLERARDSLIGLSIGDALGGFVVEPLPKWAFEEKRGDKAL